MTPAARLSAAIEVLAAIEERRRPVAEALKEWGQSHRFAGSKDRSAIGNLVYDALRWRASSAWIMDSDRPRALVLAVAARRWGLGVDDLTAMMAGDPHGPAPIEPAEAERLATADLATAPDPVRADVPDWLAGRLEQTFGAEWVAEGEALALRPPLDLRSNRLKADRARVLKALERFGAAETAWSPDAVRIAATAGDGRHPNVQVEPAFQKGWFEVQDEGSQIAALLAGGRPGATVLDLCAGAGGKTLAMAAAMGNKGQVFATDSDRVRLAPIFERLKRAGTRNVQVREAGASLDDLKGRVDVVLIDAPCTGTGVWRRRPDAKWRLTERALGDRLAEQAALLPTAVRYLKPGGRLVYVTCSLLAEENGGQVAALLARETTLRLVPPGDLIAGAGLADGFAGSALVGPEGVVLSPRRTATDGFFIAAMEQVAG